jgi:integrase
VNPSAQYLPPFGNVLIGSDDPQPFDRVAAWNDALELWLESRCSPNTQRAYAKAWQLFQESAGKQPWLVGKSDVLRWQEQMRQAGLTKETIQQRLAAVSSFYAFACASYTTYGPNGREQPLADYNPVAGIPRPRISPYNKSTYLSVDQTRALLRAIPQDNLQGLRDYALFMAYLLTGRRNSEIRLLRWGDFQVENTSASEKSWLARRTDPRRTQRHPSPTSGRRVGDEGIRGAGAMAANGRLEIVPPPAHGLTDYWRLGHNLRAWIAAVVADRLPRLLSDLAPRHSGATREAWTFLQQIAETNPI